MQFQILALAALSAVATAYPDFAVVKRQQDFGMACSPTPFGASVAFCCGALNTGAVDKASCQAIYPQPDNRGSLITSCRTRDLNPYCCDASSNCRAL